MQKAEATLPGSYEQAAACLENRMRLKYSFDMIGRRLTVGGRPATLYFVDGFIKDDIMEKIMEFTMKLTPEDLRERADTKAFADRFIPYVEVDLTDQVDKIATAVLSGTLALLVEGYPQAILIDARTYPVRGITEPDDDRVLRGSRDGFVETLVFNTALIRRRIRDPRLTMEILQIGKVSKTDVVVCYLDGRADPEIVERVKKELGKIDKPILLKRGLSNTIEELLMSAEYIMAGGNDQVILCERGIRTYETYTRNTLDISAVPILKKLSHLPVVVDPSHASGIAWLVEPLAMAAVAAGADGLIIEVHNNPAKALSDGAQSLTPDQFDRVAHHVLRTKDALSKLNA